jgi:hypothetical protein
MPPLSALAHPGSKCVIVFPDRVKGGEQPTAHRKDMHSPDSGGAVRRGRREKGYSVHLLQRPAPQEHRTGDTRRAGRRGDGRVLAEPPDHHHDSEDYDHLVDLGTTECGDPVR